MLVKRFQNGDVTIRIGLVLLIISSVSLYLARTRTSVSEWLLDGVTGLLYGLTIGCLLLGILLKSRSKPVRR